MNKTEERMKKIISYEMAKDIGLIKDPYKSRELRFYTGRYVFEGWHEAEKRRNIAEIGAKAEVESQKELPNCVDRELMLFEFEEEDIRRALAKGE